MDGRRQDLQARHRHHRQRHRRARRALAIRRTPFHSPYLYKLPNLNRSKSSNPSRSPSPPNPPPKTKKTPLPLVPRPQPPKRQKQKSKPKSQLSSDKSPHLLRFYLSSAAIAHLTSSFTLMRIVRSLLSGVTRMRRRLRMEKRCN